MSCGWSKAPHNTTKHSSFSHALLLQGHFMEWLHMSLCDVVCLSRALLEMWFLGSSGNFKQLSFSEKKKKKQKQKSKFIFTQNCFPWGWSKAWHNATKHSSFSQQDKYSQNTHTHTHKRKVFSRGKKYNTQAQKAQLVQGMSGKLQRGKPAGANTACALCRLYILTRFFGCWFFSACDWRGELHRPYVTGRAISTTCLALMFGRSTFQKFSTINQPQAKAEVRTDAEFVWCIFSLDISSHKSGIHKFTGFIVTKHLYICEMNWTHATETGQANW